ncbi:three component ABC system middle component [Pedobacter hiemivivus]|uniref:Uncharacterized protein n=1 Tax=Pedobacter hiemivivus TaxID=2530454 RepID=A0A4R0NGT6_9SPHI|nr:three component ABC system middle component [Pedobacter hiemivivus]TCC98493.1 hypothetical protein EZ444_04205 [Pedobacter hiemivivus]
MKEIYYTYNNEAIGSCVFLSILKSVPSMDIARACLILPFLLDDSTVNYLLRNDIVEGGLQQLVSEQRKLFISFNKRYLALLPVSINSLMLLNKGELIEIGKEITYKSSEDVGNIALGNRFENIRMAIPKFMSLTASINTVTLYKLLKVQL